MFRQAPRGDIEYHERPQDHQPPDPGVHQDDEGQDHQGGLLLGPNGAGKTSTLECLEGLRRPDGCRLSVAGIDPVRSPRRLAAAIGVQLQTSSLPPAMTIDEAMAHDPAVLFLDEPTAGLDVQTRAELHALVRELREAGTTVLLATHDMAEAEKLADRAAILLKGEIAALGTPRQLTAA